MLEHFFSRSSFYDIACFSILDCVSHKDAVARSSSTDAIKFNCGPLIMDASLALGDFFCRSRVLPII